MKSFDSRWIQHLGNTRKRFTWIMVPSIFCAYPYVYVGYVCPAVVFVRSATVDMSCFQGGEL